MKSEDVKYFEELTDIARKYGATDARIIPARMVVIDERVRLKCEVPRCAGYGHYLTCPPYVMPVETFRRILSRYKRCLLVQVEAKDVNSTDKGKGRINQSILKEIGNCIFLSGLSSFRLSRPSRRQLLKKGYTSPQDLSEEVVSFAINVLTRRLQRCAGIPFGQDHQWRLLE